jgi:hypothetical protein
MDFDAFCFPQYVPRPKDHNGSGKDPCHWIGSGGKHERVSGIGECTEQVRWGTAPTMVPPVRGCQGEVRRTHRARCTEPLVSSSKAEVHKKLAHVHKKENKVYEYSSKTHTRFGSA